MNTRSQTYRFAECKVTNSSGSAVNGLLLFPDGFSFPADITAPGTVNAAASYDQKTYSNAEWQKLNEAGCVFLSAAGYYGSSSVKSYGGTGGIYWSSTSGGSGAYYVGFDDDYFDASYSSNTSSYYAVRLVHE